MGTQFDYNLAILSLNDLKYFVGLTSITNLMRLGNLRSITIPANVRNLGNNFMRQAGETAAAGKEITITFDAFIETIQGLAFAQITQSKIPSIEFPAGLKYIYGDAFGSSPGIGTVKLPSSVLKIGSASGTSSSPLNNVNRKVILLATTPPTGYTTGGSCRNTWYVPDDAYTDYLNAEGWNAVPSRIKPLSDFTE